MDPIRPPPKKFSGTRGQLCKAEQQQQQQQQTYPTFFTEGREGALVPMVTS
jgi:hypothetical protein